MFSSFAAVISLNSWSIFFAFDVACSTISRCFWQLDMPSSKSSRCTFNCSFAVCHSSLSFRSRSSNSSRSSSFSLPLTSSPRVLRVFSLPSTSFIKSCAGNKWRQSIKLIYNFYFWHMPDNAKSAWYTVSRHLKSFSCCTKLISNKGKLKKRRKITKN